MKCFPTLMTNTKLVWYSWIYKQLSITCGMKELSINLSATGSNGQFGNSFAWELYERRSQSKSFNRNDLMFLLNWGWSRLINKLSLIRSLNLFASKARISKWSKSIKQLHSSRWSDTADCLTHLRCFPVNIEIPMCSAALVKKWRYVLP